MDFHHISVLLDECLEALAIKPDGIYVDGTAGGAGHSYHIASRLQSPGRLIAVDQDPDAVQIATKRLEQFPVAQVVQSNFANIPEVLDGLGVECVDGVLLDLGVSSHQLDTPARGFSYQHEAFLDMRMSQSGLSAYDIVNTWTAGELTRILREYGEERYASSIARSIERARAEQPVETTTQLAEIIKKGMPPAARREKNPARRSFQAIRIAVNGELQVLEQALERVFERLAPGGRFAVITFHSLEDRIVKQRFAAFSKGCTCPPDFPVCVCGKTPRGRLVSRKPILPGEEELAVNSRSRSAKLRVVEKL